MTFFKDLFKTAQQKRDELRELEESIRKQVADDIHAENEKMEGLRRQFEEDTLQLKMESDTPWFEPIIGANEDDPLTSRYRWNSAFINSLVKRGIKGDSEVSIFQEYLDEQIRNDRKRIIDEERDVLRNSDEPWVEVVGDHINEEGEIQLQLDWNTSFIKYLRSSGFRGATDDVIVQKWLISLNQVEPDTYQ